MKNNISIYLIKKEFDDFSNILDGNRAILKEYNKDSIVYYCKSYSKEPDWLNGFFPDIKSDDLKTSNARAVLLKRIYFDGSFSRIFAITFGYGKNMLKNNVYEEQFGLKIVLNTINANEIRKISKTDIGKNYKQSQEQMPIASSINDFSFEVETDLAKFVTGRSKDEIFGNSIVTGGDIFNLTVDKDINNIDELLKHCYKKYCEDTYKNNFPWLDNIKLVKDEKLINELNDEAVKTLNNRDFDKIWIAIPEVIDWTEIKYLYISGQKNKKEEMQDLDNNVFIESFSDATIENFSQIRNKHILAMSAKNDEEPYKEWSGVKCLVGSIKYKGTIYAINSGSWFAIDKNFSEEVEKAYEGIGISKLELMDCPSDCNEDKYIELLVSNDESMYKIHKYNIPFGGGSGNAIEPCDVAKDKNLVFIKKNGGSQYLSHLFFQTIDACEALKDVSFREKFIEKLEKDGIKDLINKDTFASNEYTIVCAIINKYNNNRPHIPFFSKASIKYAAQIIKNLGYNFEIKNIKIIDTNSK